MTRKRDEAKVAEAKRLYSLGLNTRAIAAQMHADPRTVQRWLADVIRPRGARKRPDVPDAKVAALRERDALSYPEIARRVNMSQTGARMRYYAITGRERPERRRQGAPEATEDSGEAAGGLLAGHSRLTFADSPSMFNIGHVQL